MIFADVFDPTKNQLDGMVRLFQTRDFVAEEWPVSILGANYLPTLVTHPPSSRSTCLYGTCLRVGPFGSTLCLGESLVAKWLHLFC